MVDGDTIITSTIDGEGGAYIRLGQNPVIEPLEVAENGTYSVPDGVDGYSPVMVNVPLPVIESLTARENGTYTAREGVDGYSPVTVALPEYEGAYTVEPSTEEQTLATAGKVMTRDVTVEAVEPVLWKTVTLEEDHLNGDIGNPVYWFNFLEIPYQDVADGWIYFVDFSGNQDASQYRVVRGWYDNRNVNTTTPPISCVFVRGTATIINYRDNYYLYATAGTVINVYRFRR